MDGKLIALVGCGCLVFMMLGVGGMVGIGAFALNNNDGGSSTVVVPGATSTVKDKRKDIKADEWEEIFKAAEEKLGVPWEVSAAIVYNESGGGRNFGGCSYFPKAPSRGHVLTDGNGLRSSKDKSVFKDITEEIKYPDNEPVSCNPKGSNGGAMGYMQIMPREWSSYSKKIIKANIATGMLNPWNAQDAAYVAALIIKCKAGSKYCGIDNKFPETQKVIKDAAGGYNGAGPSSSYASKVYARYLEFKQRGHIKK